MNFLSHFYFDKDTDNCYLVLGTVLPDLLKNADKNIILHPEKLNHTNGSVNKIIKGWNKHLEVDRYFHSSDFFIYHSHQLKKQLLPALAGSPVKPFFLGHVALELILDNLLLTNNMVTTESFYDHLEGCEPSVINEFLAFAGLKDTSRFFKFYADFKQSRYLNTYLKIDAVAYALKRVCMRIWTNPFTAGQELELNETLADYRDELKDSFITIYSEITDKLNRNTP